MAIYYTDVAALLTNAKDRVSGQQSKGTINIVTAKWEPSGTGEALNEYVVICTLPVGSIVLPHYSWVSAPKAASTGEVLTVSIGDATDPDRYMKSDDIAQGGLFQWAQDELSVANTPQACIDPYAILLADVEVRMKMITSTPSIDASLDYQFTVAFIHGGQDALGTL